LIFRELYAVPLLGGIMPDKPARNFHQCISVCFIPQSCNQAIDQLDNDEKPNRHYQRKQNKVLEMMAHGLTLYAHIAFADCRASRKHYSKKKRLVFVPVD